MTSINKEHRKTKSSYVLAPPPPPSVPPVSELKSTLNPCCSTVNHIQMDHHINCSGSDIGTKDILIDFWNIIRFDLTKLYRMAQNKKA